MEGHTVLRFHSSFDRCLRGLFWSLWPGWPTGSDDYSDRPTPRLLFFVAICIAVLLAPIGRDAHPADWSSDRNPRPTGASVCSRRRGEELEAEANCRAHDSAAR